MNRFAFLKPDLFVVLLLFSSFLAYLTPEIGSTPLLHRLGNIGIFTIFFCYGIGMSPTELWRGLTNWRLHLLVHAATFLVFPLVALAGYSLFANESNRLIWLGVFYAATLPSTVSSGVVLVSIARGNVPAAIFDASVSSMLGVFLTPLWMSLFLTSRGEFRLWESILELVVIFLLPIGLGMMFNGKCGAWMAAHRRYTRYFDQGVVLLIVYTSFSDSFAAKAFDGFAFGTIIRIGLGMIVLFSIVYNLVRLTCRLFRLNREDTITVLFCGSKKSLMHGTAIAKVLFAGVPEVGIILLPIMLYHALQLVIVSVIAKRYAADPT